MPDPKDQYTAIHYRVDHSIIPETNLEQTPEFPRKSFTRSRIFAEYIPDIHEYPLRVFWVELLEVVTY